MAVRRPAAPHLHPGRPGAPVRTAPAPASPEPAPPVIAPVAPEPVAPEPIAPMPVAPEPVAPVPAVPAASASTPSPAAAVRRSRRAVLLVGAAAAVTGAVGAGALLRGGPTAPSAASSRGAAPGGGSAADPFPDVPADHPAAEAIRWADRTRVQPAVSATEYAPANAVTRGDVAVALHRLAGAPAVDLPGTPVLFTDLGEDPQRVSAVLWLHGRGAVWGDAELRIRPEEPATRDGAAAMLTALLRPALAGIGVTWEATGPAVEGVTWLVAAGMAAPELADLSADAPVTRADLAVSLHRAEAVIADALG